MAARRRARRRVHAAVMARREVVRVVDVRLSHLLTTIGPASMVLTATLPAHQHVCQFDRRFDHRAHARGAAVESPSEASRPGPPTDIVATATC